MAWDVEEMILRNNLLLEIHFYVQAGNIDRAHELLQQFWERAWQAGYEMGDD
mgnify:FL=1